MALNLLDLLLQSGETATFVTKMNTLFQRLTGYALEREAKDAEVNSQALAAANSAQAAAQDATAANAAKQRAESAALAAAGSAAAAARADGILTSVQAAATAADISAKNAATSASDAARANEIAINNAQLAVDAAGTAVAAQRQVSGTIGTAAQQAAAAAKALLEQDMAGYIQQAQTARAGAEQAAGLAASEASNAANSAEAADLLLRSFAAAKTRSEFLRRAQQVLTSEAIWEVTPTAVKFSFDPSSGTQRILVMGAGEGSNSLSAGYLEINPPAAGTVVKGLGIANTVVDSNGYIPLTVYGALYYKLPAANSAPTALGEWFHTAHSAGDYDVPEDCVFIAQSMHNGAGGRKAQLFDGRILAQGLNYQDTNWILLAPYFAAGVENLGGQYTVPRFRRSNNRVLLEGVLKTTITGYTGLLASLPVGFRPSAQHLYSASVHTGSARVDVTNAGELVSFYNASSQNWISLDGINFGLD